jgi:hypothetical protein
MILADTLGAYQIWPVTELFKTSIAVIAKTEYKNDEKFNSQEKSSTNLFYFSMLYITRLQGCNKVLITIY